MSALSAALAVMRPNRPPANRRPLPGCPLSARELEVVRLLAAGMSQKQAAYRLGLPRSTVAHRMGHARRATRAASSSQVVLRAAACGWLSEPLVADAGEPPDEPRALTCAQRTYLDAFDEHLRAGDDGAELREAKRRTDAALVALDAPGRSRPSRDWMDGLVRALARVR